LRFSEASARLLVAESQHALRADTPPMPASSQILEGIPAVTPRMEQAGAEILAGATDMPAEELVSTRRGWAPDRSHARDRSASGRLATPSG
jgi:hypothetical protein